MNSLQAPPITILTVDDHPLFQQGMASVIEVEPDLSLVGQAANGAQALEMFGRLRPAVTLMDLQMPDMNGIDVIKAICAEFARARIVVLTTMEGDVHAMRAIKAGAVGYMLKSTVRKQLLDVVRNVHAGQRSIPPRIAQLLTEKRTGLTVTTREVDVLKLVAGGNTNRLIAAALGISDETVKGHVSSILAKLQARDRAHAVMIALERGILDLS
jgi:DNA-binding NarL/FixJ family response regulator